MVKAAGFPGPSEMHARVSAHDWASTPLGPPESWPPSLRALIRTLLSSSYPMVLTWGPRFCQFYNDAYSKLIGTKHPSALGEDIRVTMVESWDTLGPMIQKVMATGVANWTPALMLLMERGGYREEAYFSVSHAPAEDDTGAIAGMLAVCSEVTQQVIGDRRLRLLRDLSAKAGESRGVQKASQEVLAALSASPLDVPFALLYLRTKEDGPVTFAGAVGVVWEAAASPWPLEQALAGETVRVDDVARHLPLAGGPWGEPVTSALLMPIASSGQGAPLGVLVVGISPNRALDEGYTSFYELLASQVSLALRNAQAYEEERKRAEQLAELDRAKTAFFSNVSHEFRTPLTLMLGPLEDVLASGTLPEAAARELDVVHRNATRLLRLVNTLLDFSRLEAGRLEASFEPVDLAAYTADLASSFRSVAERAGLTLTVDCPPLPAPFYVDREMWEKIVLNLLSNAFKFTFQGTITVRLRARTGQAWLEILDTGTGIPPEDLPHLFERFYRVKGAQGRTHEGTGIGLALVQDLARLQGGEVRVESVEGQGSCFTVVLPEGREHLAPERIHVPRRQASTAVKEETFLAEVRSWWEVPSWEAPPPAPRPPSGSSVGPVRPLGRLLLADDNADMRDYVRRVLSSSFEVEAVPDGQAALEAARACVPDLILTDVMMPRLDGFGLLRELRRDPLTRTVPVVMLSARAGEESAVEGLEAGADGYMVKPFSARELVARVCSTLELSRMRRESSLQEARAEALKRAVQVRDEFLSIASHELKTPLMAFRLQLELIERSLGPESRLSLASRLSVAGRQVQRLNTLVETLLDVSQLSMGRLMLHLEEVDLAEVVGETVEQLRGSLERAGCSLTVEVERPLVGRYDRVRFERVVMNLLDNALKYGEGKPLRVRAWKEQGISRLTVADQGMGISPEDQARIFERFERAVPGRQYGGLGLGLWIARQVVEAHGGHIQVDSTPGQGTTFTVQIPQNR
ncbi:ATP-binding protein [Stigmatella aurantiaca]|uniref:histidine kinase n=1 Tax=Stigmatella aurantiaca (strain DW4/3-1) TaxID=378806 RepID=E3FG40_STIAD|nr:ATP-binding protein [Stigmatella aurantiaca]ADO68975.1 Sensor protein [Stigmatella aurantiaca DW4/3-1]